MLHVAIVAILLPASKQKGDGQTVLNLQKYNSRRTAEQLTIVANGTESEKSLMVITKQKLTTTGTLTKCRSFLLRADSGPGFYQFFKCKRSRFKFIFDKLVVGSCPSQYDLPSQHYEC